MDEIVRTSARFNLEGDPKLPLRSEPTTRESLPSMEDPVSIEVIRNLLDALLDPLEYPEEGLPVRPVDNSPVPMETASEPDANVIIIDDDDEEDDCIMLTPADENRSVRPSVIQRNGACRASNASVAGPSSRPESMEVDSYESDNLSRLENMNVESSETGGSSTPQARSGKRESDLARKPLLPKHTILKLLADAVLSYSPVVKYIAEYQYKSGSSPYVGQGCSALAFIFDKLLPSPGLLSDHDTSMMCRVLLAAIATAHHCPDARSILVTEVKSALNRALSMPESRDKHIQIQQLCRIISTMVVEQIPPTSYMRASQMSPSSETNQMIKLIVRRGIFSDLARVSNCIDMSSPDFTITVNEALKPMEVISRVTNNPTNGEPIKSTKKQTHNNLNDTRTTQSGETSTEATNAQVNRVA